MVCCVFVFVVVVVRVRACGVALVCCRYRRLVQSTPAGQPALCCQQSDVLVTVSRQPLRSPSSAFEPCHPVRISQ
jgi:hypothetical protein